MDLVASLVMVLQQSIIEWLQEYGFPAEAASLSCFHLHVAAVHVVCWHYPLQLHLQDTGRGQLTLGMLGIV